MIGRQRPGVFVLSGSNNFCLFSISYVLNKKKCGYHYWKSELLLILPSQNKIE